MYIYKNKSMSTVRLWVSGFCYVANRISCTLGILFPKFETVFTDTIQTPDTYIYMK
jgi:hypothetical protein